MSLNWGLVFLLVMQMVELKKVMNLMRKGCGRGQCEKNIVKDTQKYLFRKNFDNKTGESKVRSGT